MDILLLCAASIDNDKDLRKTVKNTVAAIA